MTTIDSQPVQSKTEREDTTLDKQSGPTMPRELGLIGAGSLIVGSMIGSGIFVSPTGVLQATGSVGLSLVVWVGAGLIALMGALCYSELGTMIQKSGGDYSYVREAYGDMVAFLNIWVQIVLIRPSSLAVMALTFGTYFSALFDLCGQPQLLVRLAATACIVTVMIVNCYSTRLASRVITFATFCKVSALFVIISGGIIRLVQGHTSVIASGFQGSTSDPTVIAFALYDALYAYGGWSNLNMVTEEVKRPQRNLPIANIGSVTLVIIIYVSTNIAYLSAMTTTEMLEADAVAVLFGNRVLKSVAMLIPISVMLSTFGSVNSSSFSSGRPVFVASRDGNLPDILSYIHKANLTPMPTMIFTLSMALVFVYVGNISGLINALSFTAWLFYGMNFLGVLIFRYKRPDAPRPYKCPIIIPIIMVMVSLYLVVAPIVKDPGIEFLYAALFILAGLVLYFPFVHFKWKLPLTDNFVTFVQLLMEVVPSSKYTD